MKKNIIKTVISISGGILWGLLAFWARNDQRNREASLPGLTGTPIDWPEILAESGAVTVGLLLAIFAIPWLWNGFLKRTREVSKAVRGKE